MTDRAEHGARVGHGAPAEHSARVGSALRIARTLGLPLLSLAVLVGLWAALVEIFTIDEFILPSPAAVWRSLVSWHGTLLRESRTTLAETVLGFGLAVGAGLSLGLLMAFSSFARASMYPLLVASQMVPKVALAPIFIVWFGLGMTAKVTVAFLVAFFPVLVSTAIGMGQTEAEMVRLFRSMRAGWVQTFIKLRLPVALPAIFGGMKVAITLAVVGAIVGEFIGGDGGVGYFVLNQSGQLNTAAVYAGLVMITAIGVVLYFALELLEWLVSPQRKSRVGGSRLAV